MPQINASVAENLSTLSSANVSAPAQLGSAISAVELLTLLLRKKRLVAGTTAGAALAALVAAFCLPVWYLAEAIILPPQQQQSSIAAFSGAIGTLAGSSVASQLGLKSPSDLYIGLLGSRNIADYIVNEFHLKTVYGKKLSSDARKTLSKHVTFSSGKDSLIKIAFEDIDPKRAADIANAFVDELYKQNSRLALTDASQRRLFFDEQLAIEREALAKAESDLKDTQQSTGMLAPTGQAEALIRSAAQLRAEIVSREVQLRAMRSFATEQNPQLQLLEEEIKSFKSELAAIEANGGSGSKFELSAGKLPEANLEYLRKFRGLKYHETLYELLAKQYEAARIDEAKQAPLIQVVDRATVPDKKSWPPRALLVCAGALVGFLISSICVVISGSARVLSQSPENLPWISSLREAIRA